MAGMSEVERTPVDYNGQPGWQYPDGSIRSRVTGRFIKAGEGSRFKPGDRRTRAAGKAGAEAMLRRRPAAPRDAGPAGRRATGAPGAGARGSGPHSSRQAGRGPGVPGSGGPGLRALWAECPAEVRDRLEALASGDLGTEAPGPPQGPGPQGPEGGHGAAGPSDGDCCA